MSTRFDALKYGNSRQSNAKAFATIQSPTITADREKGHASGIIFIERADKISPIGPNTNRFYMTYIV